MAKEYHSYYRSTARRTLSVHLPCGAFGSLGTPWFLITHHGCLLNRCGGLYWKLSRQTWVILSADQVKERLESFCLYLTKYLQAPLQILGGQGGWLLPHMEECGRHLLLLHFCQPTCWTGWRSRNSNSPVWFTWSRHPYLGSEIHLQRRNSSPARLRLWRSAGAVSLTLRPPKDPGTRKESRTSSRCYMPFDLCILSKFSSFISLFLSELCILALPVLVTLWVHSELMEPGRSPPCSCKKKFSSFSYQCQKFL